MRSGVMSISAEHSPQGEAQMPNVSSLSPNVSSLSIATARNPIKTNPQSGSWTYKR